MRYRKLHRSGAGHLNLRCIENLAAATSIEVQAALTSLLELQLAAVSIQGRPTMILLALLIVKLTRATSAILLGSTAGAKQCAMHVRDEFCATFTQAVRHS
jgi:hypothetical protein